MPSPPRTPYWVLRLYESIWSSHRNPAQLISLLVLLEATVAVMVYVTGGTTYVYLQLMYLPIVLSGLIFGPLGGLAGALFGGLLLGPFMPLNTETGEGQNLFAWVFRIFFFSLVGLTTGLMSQLLQQRMRYVETLSEQLSLSYGRSLRTLAELVAQRDDKTADHSERVAYNAYIIGKYMGLSGAHLEALYWGALLHDVGKIGISEAILNKPGPLTPQERREMERHVEIGHQVVMSASPQFAPIAEGVRHHHERWDGQGYPDRLRGEEIPLPARILAVLDVFEALTSNRPYRQPLPDTEALAVLEKESGSHFDPKVVGAFGELLRAGRIVSGEVPREGRAGLLPFFAALQQDTYRETLQTR